MEHSLYHLYEQAMRTRDLTIFALVTVASAALLLLWSVNRVKPGAGTVGSWLLIGGFHATLLAAFIIL